MSLCILTDSSALFPPTSPNGGRTIRTINFKANGSSLLPPDQEAYLQVLNELEPEFNSILVLTGSEGIFPGFENARLAAQSHGGLAKIEVLDTLQIGPGLGLLTQLAARKASSGSSLADLLVYMRAVIPFLFTIICPDGLPQPQARQNSSASPGEQPGILPVYSLEEGLLATYKKIRTQRHLLEIFQEFMEEFESPQQFVFFHGKNTGLHIRPLRESISNLFPGAHFTDLEINDSLVRMFGEHTVGLTVLELPRERV